MGVSQNSSNWMIDSVANVNAAVLFVIEEKPYPGYLYMTCRV